MSLSWQLFVLGCQIFCAVLISPSIISIWKWFVRSTSRWLLSSKLQERAWCMWQKEVFAKNHKFRCASWWIKDHFQHVNLKDWKFLKADHWRLGDADLELIWLHFTSKDLTSSLGLDLLGLIMPFNECIVHLIDANFQELIQDWTTCKSLRDSYQSKSVLAYRRSLLALLISISAIDYRKYFRRSYWRLQTDSLSRYTVCHSW